MSQLTIAQRRRRLSFADDVAELAMKAPDLFTKQQVYRAVNAIRRESGFSDHEKKLWLLKLIEHGCSSHKDLANESDIPRPEISRLLRELESEKKVSLRPMSSPWKGRPSQFIELIPA